jgi:hypothetical protein
VKSKANKGFIKELSNTKPEINKPKVFSYSKPVVKPTANAGATTYRLREHKTSKPPTGLQTMVDKVGKK